MFLIVFQLVIWHEIAAVVVIQALLRINKLLSIQSTLHLWQNSAKAADLRQAPLLLLPLALLVLFHPRVGSPLETSGKLADQYVYVHHFFDMSY